MARIEKCPCCDGWGKRLRPSPRGYASPPPEEATCPACDGWGVIDPLMIGQLKRKKKAEAES